MTGTFINVATIIVGSTLGLFIGERLPQRARETVVAGLGLFTAAIGLQMFLKTENAIIVLLSLLFGGLLGEWWRIETRLEHLGAWLEARFAGEGDSARFIQGFLTASLLFCVGPMSILGSIQDGLLGDYKLLAIKAVLDGFASLAFASTLGIGVMFSIIVVLVYQGGISLAAAQLHGLLSQPAMINELTAAGGIILLGLAVSSLLEIKPIRSGNLLPALVIAPLLVWLVGAAPHWWAFFLQVVR